MVLLVQSILLSKGISLVKGYDKPNVIIIIIILIIILLYITIDYVSIAIWRKHYFRNSPLFSFYLFYLIFQFSIDEGSVGLSLISLLNLEANLN